ncbi:hypothetical protein GCK32_002785 [Trichostrongylus colubriformis]
MSEIVESLESTHPLHLLYNKTHIRYEFGSTYYNFCELKVQPHHSLPSLLRVMEMKIMPQACLRAVVLVGLLLKFMLCMAQAKVDYMLSSRRTIFLILSRVSPLLQLTSTSVLMFIVCLQQDQDKDITKVDLLQRGSSSTAAVRASTSKTGGRPERGSSSSVVCPSPKR